MSTELYVNHNCCGVLEVKNLSDSNNAKEAFMTLCKIITQDYGAKYLAEDEDHLQENGEPFYVIKYKGAIPFGINYYRPYIMFTGVVGDNAKKVGHHPEMKKVSGYGDDMAEFIRNHGLGTLIETEPNLNFTGNWLKVYLWTPDYPKIMVLYNQLLNSDGTASVDPSTSV